MVRVWFAGTAVTAGPVLWPELELDLRMDVATVQRLSGWTPWADPMSALVEFSDARARLLAAVPWLIEVAKNPVAVVGGRQIPLVCASCGHEPVSGDGIEHATGRDEGGPMCLWGCGHEVQPVDTVRCLACEPLTEDERGPW